MDAKKTKKSKRINRSRFGLGYLDQIEIKELEEFEKEVKERISNKNLKGKMV